MKFEFFLGTKKAYLVAFLTLFEVSNRLVTLSFAQLNWSLIVLSHILTVIFVVFYVRQIDFGYHRWSRLMPVGFWLGGFPTLFSIGIISLLEERRSYFAFDYGWIDLLVFVLFLSALVFFVIWLVAWFAALAIKFIE